MCLSCNGQQQEAGAQEGTLNEHVARVALKPVRKVGFREPPTLGRDISRIPQDPHHEGTVLGGEASGSLEGTREDDNSYKRQVEPTECQPD